MADPGQVGGEQGRRRRRVRRGDENDGARATPGSAAATTSAADDPIWNPAHAGPAASEATAASETDGAAERGLRGLVGGGASQVRPGAAMRARDAARPREADLARAEAELVIIRRNWSPRD